MALDFFSEFNGIVRALQKTKIRYAVVGGVAVAIYGGVRATKDIDFMVHPDDVGAFRELLKSLSFRAHPEPLSFRDAGLTLHRFLKFEPGQEHFYIVDVLAADTDRNRRMLGRADQEKWSDGVVRVLKKKDLMKLKKARGSHADLADIAVLRGCDEEADQSRKSRA